MRVESTVPKVNPYQAPETTLGGYNPTAEVDGEVENAWRWQNAMIIRSRSKPKLPQQCAVTYLPGVLTKYPISAISRFGLRLSFFCFLVPAIGWIAFILMVIPTSQRQDFRLPMRVPVAVALLFIELSFFGFLVGGNALAAYGIFIGSPLGVVGGTLLSLLAFAIFWGTDRLFLRTDLLDRQHVAVRGLNEQFLASLPPMDTISREWLQILS